MDIRVIACSFLVFLAQVLFDLPIMKMHQHVSDWQTHCFFERIEMSKRDPSLGMVIFSTDWAERMPVLFKEETMAMHWGTKQV